MYTCNKTIITIPQGDTEIKVEAQFRCEDTGRCIDQAYKCDGELDCCRKDESEDGNSTCSDTTDEYDCGT